MLVTSELLFTWQLSQWLSQIIKTHYDISSGVSLLVKCTKKMVKTEASIPIKCTSLETENGIINVVNNTPVACSHYCTFAIKNQFLVGPEPVQTDFQCNNVICT